MPRRADCASQDSANPAGLIPVALNSSVAACGSSRARFATTVPRCGTPTSRQRSTQPSASNDSIAVRATSPPMPCATMSTVAASSPSGVFKAAFSATASVCPLVVTESPSES